MVIGRIILNANNSKTTVIARLDSDGCLEPDCGIFNDITSYLTSTKTVVNVDFDIYPNPVAGILNIKMNGVPDKVEIYDLSGQQIKADKKTIMINVEDLQKGIYFIKIYMDGKVGGKEFVKS